MTAQANQDSLRAQALTLDDIRGRATISVREAAQVLGIGRDAAYAAVAAGELPCLRIGRRRLVSVPALTRWLEGEAAGSAKPTAE